MQTLVLEKTTTRDVLLVLLMSFAISLTGQFSIPLWFTPIPLAIQNVVVLMAGALLGAKRGAAAVFAFLVQGAIGLPVFSGKLGGAAVLMGPRGGYLLGYLVGAFIVGYMVEKKWHPILAMTAGVLATYALGASWFAGFVGPAQALLLGVVPFVVGDILKILVCTQILGRVSTR